MLKFNDRNWLMALRTFVRFSNIGQSLFVIHTPRISVRGMAETVGAIGLFIGGGIPESGTGLGTELGTGLGTTIGVKFQEGAVGGAGVVRGILTFGNKTGRKGGCWAVAPPPYTVIAIIRIAKAIAHQRFERVDIKLREWGSGNETQINEAPIAKHSRSRF